MSTTLEKWKERISGQVPYGHYEKSEFIDLIPHKYDHEYLYECFSELPHGKTLIKKLNILLEENNSNGLYIVPNKDNYVSQDELKVLALNWIDSLSNFLKMKGEKSIANEINIKKVEFVHDLNGYYNFIGNLQQTGLTSVQASAVINDITIDDYFDNAENYIYELHEACLFLTKSPDITRYLLQDILQHDLDFNSYYKFWRAGGEVFFFEEKTLIYSPNI